MRKFLKNALMALLYTKIIHIAIRTNCIEFDGRTTVTPSL